MSDFQPIMFPSNTEQASAMREAARRFDGWAQDVSAFVSGVQAALQRDGEPVWKCRKADEFYALWNRDPAFGKNIPGYRDAYLSTAENLRRAAKALEEYDQKHGKGV